MVSSQGLHPFALALIASQVPKNQSGYALGTLIDRNCCRYLDRPLIWEDWLQEQFGMQMSFSSLVFPSFSSLSWLGGALRRLPTNIQEHLSSWGVSSIQHKDILGQYDHSDDRSVHFSHSLPLCKRAWPERQCYFVSGLIVSAMGFLVSDIRMDEGKLGDKWQPSPLTFSSSLYSGILYLLLPLARNPFSIETSFVFYLGLGQSICPGDSSKPWLPRKNFLSFRFNNSSLYWVGPMMGSSIAMHVSTIGYSMGLLI